MNNKLKTISICVILVGLLVISSLFIVKADIIDDIGDSFGDIINPEPFVPNMIINSVVNTQISTNEKPKIELTPYSLESYIEFTITELSRGKFRIDWKWKDDMSKVVTEKSSITKESLLTTLISKSATPIYTKCLLENIELGYDDGCNKVEYSNELLVNINKVSSTPIKNSKLTLSSSYDLSKPNGSFIMDIPYNLFGYKIDGKLFDLGFGTASFNLQTPENLTWTNNNTISFNFTLIGNYSSYYAELYINGTGYGFNTTVLNNTATIIMANRSIPDGTYYYWINATNDTTEQSTPRLITIDTAIPQINLTSPVNGSYYNTSSILFNVSSSESGTGSIIPNLDNSLISWWRMDDVNASGTGIVDYMGRNNGTIRGSPVQVSNGKFGKAFSFNGINSLLNNTQLISNVTNFTVSVWFNPSAFAGYNQIVTSTGFYSQASRPFSSGWGFWTAFNGNTMRFSVAYNSTVAYAATTPAFTLTAGNWYFLTATYNKDIGNVTLYANGVIVGSSANNNVTNFTGNGFIIGGSSVLTGFANGSIDDVMIFNRSLSAEEILSLYNATKSQFYNNLSDGSHTYQAYTQDLAGNIFNSSLINFTIDTTKPDINITYPLNITYSINVTALNFSVSDLNLQKCWYSLDNGKINTSVTCGNNITGIGSLQGWNNWTVYANDSYGNINSSKVTFFYSSVGPNISILYPNSDGQNFSYNINVNFTTATDSISSCWWTNSSGKSNNTITCGNNITGQVWNEGSNTVTVYVNDTYNIVNYSTRKFTIDTIYPTIDFIEPTPNLYVQTSPNISINFTGNEINRNNGWILLNNIIYNVNCNGSLPYYCYYNFASLAEGQYNLTAYINDSVGHVNNTDMRSFEVLVIRPPGGTGFSSASYITPEGIITKNPKSIELNFDPIWYKDSENKIIVTVINLNGTKYLPRNIYYEYDKSSMVLNSNTELNKDIVSSFNVFNNAKARKSNITIFVEDQRNINKTITIEIKDKLVIDNTKIIKYIFYGVFGFLILMVLILIFMAIMVDKKKN